MSRERKTRKRTRNVDEERVQDGVVREDEVTLVKGAVLVPPRGSLLASRAKGEDSV